MQTDNRLKDKRDEFKKKKLERNYSKEVISNETQRIGGRDDHYKPRIHSAEFGLHSRTMDSTFPRIDEVQERHNSIDPSKVFRQLRSASHNIKVMTYDNNCLEASGNPSHRGLKRALGSVFSRTDGFSEAKIMAKLPTQSRARIITSKPGTRRHTSGADDIFPEANISRSFIAVGEQSRRDTCGSERIMHSSSSKEIDRRSSFNSTSPLPRRVVREEIIPGETRSYQITHERVTSQPKIGNPRLVEIIQGEPFIVHKEELNKDRPFLEALQRIVITTMENRRLFNANAVLITDNRSMQHLIKRYEIQCSGLEELRQDNETTKKENSIHLARIESLTQELSCQRRVIEGMRDSFSKDKRRIEDAGRDFEQELTTLLKQKDLQISDREEKISMLVKENEKLITSLEENERHLNSSIDELEQEKQSLNSRLQALQNRLQDSEHCIDKRLNEIEEISNEVEVLLRENEVLNNVIQQKDEELEELKGEIKSLDKILEKKVAEYNQIELESTAKAVKIEEMKAKLENADKEAFKQQDIYRSTESKFEQEKQNLLNSISNQTEEIMVLSSELKSLSEEKYHQEKRLSEFQVQIQQLNNIISELESSNLSLLKQLSNHSKSEDVLQSEIRELTSKIDDYCKDEMEMSKILSIQKEEIRELSKFRDDLYPSVQNQNSKLMDDLNRKNQQIVELRGFLDNSEGRLNSLMQNLRLKDEQLSSLNERFSKYNCENSNLRDRLNCSLKDTSNRQITISSLQGEIEQLKEDKNKIAEGWNYKVHILAQENDKLQSLANSKKNEKDNLADENFKLARKLKIAYAEIERLSKYSSCN